MRIGELATSTGVSVRALRYYEEQNLLTSDRTPSGQRQYPDSATDRVLLIQQLYAAGIPSKSIAALLPCVVNGEATPELLTRLAAERDHIDTRITALTTARTRLNAVIVAATTNLQTGQPCQLP
ncbi:MerR family transcriptional regulator [Embleya sp. NPDC055664]